MRILWYSNSPHVGSGYGNQTALFVPRIKALGHEIAAAAFWGIQGGRVEMDGMSVYPASPTGAIDYASMGLPAEHFKADVIISLMDVWAVQKGMSGNVRLAPWFPVDHEPLPPPIAVRLRSDVLNPIMPLVFSRFGEQMVRGAGFDCRYIPHGVDTSIFTPGDKQEARRILGLPQDDFIIGIVAANLGTPSRKALKQQIMAFAKLRQRHKDARLFLHTRVDATGLGGASGENLTELIQQLGIADGISSTDQTAYHFGLESDELNLLYNSFDVLSNVSMGEGFGIPILEAQSAGTPVIVGDWTAMSELNFSGWAVPKEHAERWHTALGSYQWWPGVQGIADLYETAYNCTTLAKRGVKARSEALRYDAALVAQRDWAPVLTEIEELLTAQPISFSSYVSAAS